jgi:rapamycin-insensitive companion of mTOR
MHCYEFLINIRVGLPNNSVISNNMIDLKLHFFSDIGDEKFQLKVKATKILQEKDWRKWNWEIILELCEGNLITTPRLESLIQKTKFIKRLLNFYLPSKQQFINLPWRQENLIYAKAGYYLFKRLVQDKIGRKTLSSPEGVFHVLGVTFVEN